MLWRTDTLQLMQNNIRSLQEADIRQLFKWSGSTLICEFSQQHQTTEQQRGGHHLSSNYRCTDRVQKDVKRKSFEKP